MALETLHINRLVRPYWKPLAVAFGSMLIAGASELLEPWPLKIIFDHVIGSKPMPSWIARWPVIGGDRLGLLDAAALAVDATAVFGLMPRKDAGPAAA